MDLWKHHIALTTVLCFQNPPNFEVESQYQLKSSKQADMLITTTGFFLLSYYKIKQAETCTGAKKGMRATKN